MTTRRGAAPHRATELEQRFGDPYEPGNPLGFTAVLEADERAEMFADGESALDDYGLNAEFVPPSHGGRLDRMDDLIEVMRSVYRRDPALGLGYGAASFIASTNVWSSADPEQAAEVARLLLSGRKVACAYHELAHGNDMANTEFAAMPGPDGLLLNGRKEVVTNIRRADALVMFARTDTRRGSRSHSQVYVDKSALAAGSFRDLPRFPSTGMRGVQLGGIEFTDCPLDAGNLLGTPGHGLETAMKSFQLTRTALPAMMTAALDTGLRTTLGHTTTRRLYGGPVSDIPYVRTALAESFADLLLCEAFSLVGARALHLLPGQTSVYASAVKYGISGPLMDAVHRLSVVMGAQSYLRDGPNAIFQKMHRDVQPVGFGHAARAACQISVLPQLPLLARRSWSAPAATDPNLFRLDAELPELDLGRLTVNASGGDALGAALLALPDELPDDPGGKQLHSEAQHFGQELRRLAEECRSLPPRELTFLAEPASYEAVDAYVSALMAGSCLQIWRHNPDDPFLGRPAWVRAALHRLHARAGTGPRELPDDLVQELYGELLDRHAHDRSFGITNRPFSGR
ncbi:acyl-CoA dehydrogenase [Streptomyces globisporus]|nr:acyl-CoA dehydrogenase [Streptomyces globisporus]